MLAIHSWPTVPTAIFHFLGKVCHLPSLFFPSALDRRCFGNLLALCAYQTLIAIILVIFQRVYDDFFVS